MERVSTLILVSSRLQSSPASAQDRPRASTSTTTIHPLPFIHKRRKSDENSTASIVGHRAPGFFFLTPAAQKSDLVASYTHRVQSKTTKELLILLETWAWETGRFPTVGRLTSWQLNTGRGHFALSSFVACSKWLGIT